MENEIEHVVLFTGCGTCASAPSSNVSSSMRGNVHDARWHYN